MGNAFVYFFQNIPQQATPVNKDTYYSNSPNIDEILSAESEFNNKLIEYKNAYANYIQISKSPYANYYVGISPGTKYVGKQVIATNLKEQDCATRCSADSSCSGVNYNTATQICTDLQSGVGTVETTGDTNNWAVIKRKTQALIDLGKINAQLIELNKKVLAANNNIQSKHYAETNFFWDGDNMNILFKNDKILFNNNQTLMQEREKIRKTLEEYNDTNTEFSNRSIDVEQKNVSYNIWFIIMVVFICILFKLFLIFI